MTVMPASISPPPLVTVIVPTYNYGHFIGETLESLHAQTYQNWECIIVDDGSTDHTSEIVAGYVAQDARIKFIQQKNQRQAAARNHGLKHATGQYIQFLDADDLLEPEKFARQVAYLEQYPEVDIVYSNVRYFETGKVHERRFSSGDEGERWMPEISGAGKGVLMSLLRNNIMAVNASLFKRSTVEMVGLFNEKLPPVEDWDYLIRCAVAGARFQYEDAEGVRALVRSHPTSSSHDRRGMIRAELLMREEIRPFIAEPEMIRLNEERMAEGVGLLGVEEVVHGGRARGFYQFLKAGVMDHRLRFRLKWALCALAVPFITGQQLRMLVSTSLSQTAATALRRSS